MSRRNVRRGRRRFRETEDLNPMSYLSNLSDVMLILAVGIMLALVLHWNVNLEVEDPAAEETVEESGTEVTTFQNDELTDTQEVPDTAQPMGTVLYDPTTGTYYVVEDSAE